MKADNTPQLQEPLLSKGKRSQTKSSLYSQSSQSSQKSDSS